MFIPLHDENNALVHIMRPVLTFSFIAMNVVVWAAVATLSPLDQLAAVVTFAFKPGGLPDPTAALLISDWAPPGFLAILTSMFLHQDLWHLVGNMAFLYVFGDNVEDALGHVRFALFFILCGVAGALAQAFATPGVVLYGASGAISGVIAAYVLLHPNVRLWVLVLMRVPLRIRALWVIIAWIGFQIYSATFVGGDSGIGWWAHLGGVAAGLILMPLMKRSEVALLDKGPDSAR